MLAALEGLGMIPQAASVGQVVNSLKCDPVGMLQRMPVPKSETALHALFRLHYNPGGVAEWLAETAEFDCSDSLLRGTRIAFSSPDPSEEEVVRAYFRPLVEGLDGLIRDRPSYFRPLESWANSSFGELTEIAERNWNFRGRLALSLAKAGLGESALQAAQEAIAVAREVWDDVSRVRILKDVASALALTGDRNSAREIFDEALTAAREITDNAMARSNCLQQIASALAPAGFRAWSKEIFEESITVAGTVLTETETAGGGLIVLDASSGDAHAVVPDDYHSLAFRLELIASSLAGAGFRERAREVFVNAVAAARETAEGQGKSESLMKIASSLSERGFFRESLGVFNEAVAATRGIEDAESRSYRLGDIAGSLAEAGFSDAARNVVAEMIDAAQGIRNARRRSWFLSLRGRRLVEASLADLAREVFGEAIASARGIKGVKGLLARIVRTAESVLRWAGFETWAERILYDEDRSHALEFIAGDLGAVGFDDWSREVASEIER